jgi:hypothetical protein
MDMYNKFKKYIVFAENLREFCEQWHRADKVADKEADYESHKRDMEKYGYTIIPASTSKTGEIVSYYGKI